MPPHGRWRPHGAYLRDGEAVRVMPSEPGCALADPRPSPAITAELLVPAEPQPEELPSQESGREGPESGHIPERSGLNPVPHAPG